MKSVYELCNSRKGNCHDQAIFISKALSYIGVKNKLLFFIEYNENESSGGRTHTLCYYTENNKIYWMETSWGGLEKIHGPFKNENELKSYIEEIHSKEPQSKRYPLIEWGNVSKVKPGMSLEKYVDCCLGNDGNGIFEGVVMI